MAGSTLASPSAEPVAAAAARPVAVSPGRETWRRFRRHRLAMVSAVVLGLLILGVIVGPWFWAVPINEIDFTAQLETPSWKHPFGTDDLGQDLLARMMYGGRISLAVGLAAMVVATTVGVVIGALAGMSRRYLDSALMWLTDLFLSLPQLPLLLLIIYLFREQLKAMFGVEGGVFVPGEQMPSTKELSEQLDVSLVTAHRALQELVAAGVLERSQGRGTFVHHRYQQRKQVIAGSRVGLVFHRDASLADFYQGQLLEGIHRAANRLGEVGALSEGAEGAERSEGGEAAEATAAEEDASSSAAGG